MKKFLLISLIAANFAVQATDQKQSTQAATAETGRIRKRDRFKSYFGYGPLATQHSSQATDLDPDEEATPTTTPDDASSDVKFENPAYGRVNVTDSDLQPSHANIAQFVFTDLVALVTDYKSDKILPENRADLLKLIFIYVNDEVKPFSFHTWGKATTIKIQGQGTLSKQNVVEIEFLLHELFAEDYARLSQMSVKDKANMLAWGLSNLDTALLRPVVANEETLTPIEKSWKKWAKRTGIAALVTTVALVAASAKRV